MKLTKNWKRILAGFMAGIMLFLSVDAGSMAAFAAEIQEQNNEKHTKEIEVPQLMTGLLPLELEEMQGEECAEEVYDYRELVELQTYSMVYNNEWDKYSTKYYYNQLNDEWKMVWDAMDALLLDMLLYESTDITKYLSVPDNTTRNDLITFIELFMESNPQYYFLRYAGTYFSDQNQYVTSFSLRLYDNFEDGQARAAATAKFKSKIDAAIAAINVELDKLGINVTEQDKLLEIYKYVIKMTEYNYGVLTDDPETEDVDESKHTEAEEQEYYTQSAYSAFCLGTTVCAGYAEAMQLLCNAYDIDAINVTSHNHKWNKVRINDSWYNVDPTWGDAGDANVEEHGEKYAVNYKYYGRSDSFYESDNTSHVMESFWDTYIPVCVQETVSQAEEAELNKDYVLRTFVMPEETIPAPVITVTKIGNDTYQVELSVDASENEALKDVVIYYTKDDTTPSCAATKSYIYSTPFEVTGDYVINAIATLDGYYDSNVVEEAKKPTVKNLVLNDHFYNKMTFQWDVLDEASGYVLDIYQGEEKLLENKIATEIISDKNIHTYDLDTSAYEPGTIIFYEIRAYVDEVTNVSEAVVSQKCKTKSQPLNVDVKWHVTKLNDVDFLTIDVAEILDGNATLQDEMWIWYYSDVDKIAPDASFKIDVSDGKNSFMYTLAEHGMAFDKAGYLYVTNKDKTSAFQEDAFVVGGTFVEPELLPIEDKVAQVAGETIVLQAVIAPENKMENFRYTYQWFVAEDEFAKGIAIEGATKDTYQVQIGSFDEKFYYCEVTTEYGTKYVSTTSNGTSTESGEKEHTRVSGELFGSQVTIASILDQTYTGSAINPEIVITNQDTGNVLVKGEDYTITYTDNTNEKNNVEGTVTFIGDYANTSTAKVYFNIVPKNVENNASIDVFEVDNVIYSGIAYTPNGEIWDTERNVKLVENVDYRVSHSGNTDAGTGVVTLDFIGNYTGTRFINYRIFPKDISNEDVVISSNDSQIYTGYEIIPDLVIEYGGNRLKQDKDFELECSKNVNVGTANVTIHFIGNYAGSKETTFTIVQRNASDLTIDSIVDQEYTGHAITPSLGIVYSSESSSVALHEGTDYTATYTNNIDKGTASISLEFVGNYTGTRTVTFTIVARSAENVTCEPIPSVTYTGEPLEPKPVIKNGNLVLEEGKDYELSYANNVSVGENIATVIATFKGNYYGTKEMNFTILPRNAEHCKVKFEIPNQVYSYTGQKIEPAVIVTDGDKVLVKGTDYTVTYDYDKNVGNKTVQVDFMGNYVGTQIIEFSIISKSITAADLILEGLEDIQEFIYNGLEHTPEITIKDKSLGELLRQGVDYAIEFANNIMAGMATIKIEFLSGGNYIGKTIERFFTIKARTTEHVVISDIPEQRYTGNAITPELEIKDTEANVTLVKDQDYTVEYKNNVKEGIATVVVSFKGNFVGDPMTKTFTIINPVPTTITSNSFHVNQSNGYISKVTVGTTANALWSGLNEKDYVVIYDKNGAVVSGSTVIGTGMTAVIMDEGTTVKRYTIVVTGDTNGDGKINITDMIAVKACTLKKSGLSGAYEKAGDVNGDGKINITDFIKVKATTLKKDTITGVEVK